MDVRPQDSIVSTPFGGGTAPSISTPRAGFCRVTVIGTDRRADVVLPSGEPLGVLWPELLNLIADPVDETPKARRLLTADGVALDAALSLRESGVLDGAVLRIVHVGELPNSPVIRDVTDAVAEDLDARRWRWTPRAGQVVTTILVLALALLGARIVASGWPGRPAVVAQACAAGALVLAGSLLTLLARSRSGAGIAAMLLGAVLGVTACITAADVWAWGNLALLTASALVTGLTLALLGAVTALGRAGLIGALTVVGTTLVWITTAALLSEGVPGPGVDGRVPELGAVPAVLAVAVLGLLPRTAMVSAGLTKLDDQLATGSDVTRQDVGRALAGAHRSMVIGTLTLAAATAGAGWLLATPGPDGSNTWAVLLAVVLVVALLTRARAFPLAAEVTALLAAAAVICARLVLVWLGEADGPPAGPLTLVVTVAALLLLTLAVRPPEHVRARLRQIADRLEAASVIALLPLAIGVYGVYGRLLDAF